MTKGADELLADDLRQFNGLVEGQRRRNVECRRPRGRVVMPIDLADRLLVALHRTPPSVTDEGIVERVIEAWENVRESLNKLHVEGAITYGELKHGVNSAAFIRDAALQEVLSVREDGR